jgi:polysaccharide biosynthesis protein PslH
MARSKGDDKSMQKLKVLFCSPYALDCENSNGVNKINFNIMPIISKRCDLTIVQPTGEMNLKSNIDIKLIHLSKNIKKEISFFFKLKSLFFPFSLDEYVFYDMGKELADIINSTYENYDVIHISSFQLSSVFKYLSPAAAKKSIFFAIDSKVLHEKSKVMVSKGMRKIYRKYLYYKSVYCVRRVYSLANWLCFVSEFDAKSIEKIIPNKSIATIPNGVFINHGYATSEYDFSEISLCFHGDMGYPPNKSALLKLIEFLPIIQTKVSIPVTLKLIGNGSEKYNDPDCGILGMGFIDDIYGELAKCNIYISLVNTGAGIKNKLLDAMSLGLPIIATKSSMEGIAYASSGIHYLEVEYNDVDMIIDKLNSILFKFDLAENLSNSSLSCVEKNYSWDKVATDYIGLYKRVVKNECD